MTGKRDLARITVADFIVRSAYQMGKSPLLPIFAASLGATDVLLGFIVSVSTITGMVTKPLVGLLSDRQGRRAWLLAGTAFFAFTPFAYWFVHTPGQMILVRVLHGSATAIYGPVTVAWVAENAPGSRAENLGWFGLARNGGYIVGPALAGWMLLTISPQAVYTVIGLSSCLAFWFIMRLSDPYAAVARTNREPFGHQLRRALEQGRSSTAVWLSGALESLSYIALYALKAFLPVYALQQGYNAVEVGLFFSVQEIASAVCKPFTGRLGDHIGYRKAISIGMIGMALFLPLIGLSSSWVTNLALAAMLGLCQAIIFPSTTALVAEQMGDKDLGAGIGLVGTLQNFGKVAGPIIGGILLTRFTFHGTFLILSAFLILGLFFLWKTSIPGVHAVAPKQTTAADGLGD
jgi:MFS family permease